MVWDNVLIKEAEQIKENTGVKDPVCLLVWNDNINTFEWVIQSLVEICGHTHDQAEQCAWIIHTKGKYAVKHGSRNKLSPHAGGTC